MSTEVVHVRRAPYDIYIGRATGPRNPLPASKWGNPFHIGKDGTREEVLAKYIGWLTTERLDLLAVVQTELRGKRLACWCAPKPCHGDVLAKLADHPFPLLTVCECGCYGFEHDTHWDGDVFVGTRCIVHEHGGHKFAPKIEAQR